MGPNSWVIFYVLTHKSNFLYLFWSLTIWFSFTSRFWPLSQLEEKKSLAKWQELQHYNSIIFPTSYKNDKWCWVCIQCWWHYTVVYKQYWVWQLEPVTLNIIFSLVKACKALLCSFELGQVILFLNTQSWHCWWSMCY